jgi:hypothetical protein
VVVLASLLAGCAQHPPLPPVVGAEEQATARTAFEQFQAALERGDQDKVWDGLSARSQRIKESGGKQGPGEKAKALELARQLFGRKPKIKEVFGTRSGTVIGLEYPDGKNREFEMVLEDGAWKLNLFSS